MSRRLSGRTGAIVRAMPSAGEQIAEQMQLLVRGRRSVKARQAGDIYGLRISNEKAVPALVVLGSWPQGFHEGATVLWPLGPPQPVASDPALKLDSLSPLTAPLIVGRSLWSLGYAFRWSRVEATHPLLQRRFLFRHMNGNLLDWTGATVRSLGPEDVIGDYSYCLPLGVDDEIRVALSGG